MADGVKKPTADEPVWAAPFPENADVFEAIHLYCSFCDYLKSNGRTKVTAESLALSQCTPGTLREDGALSIVLATVLVESLHRPPEWRSCLMRLVQMLLCEPHSLPLPVLEAAVGILEAQDFDDLILDLPKAREHAAEVTKICQLLVTRTRVEKHLGEQRFAEIETQVCRSCDVSCTEWARAHPGVSAGVVISGRVVHQSSSGVCRVAPHSMSTGQSIDSDTIFLTASISKTVLAIACLQAVERGEFDLDIDIAAIVGSATAAKTFDNEKAKAVAVIVATRNPAFPSAAITPRHLLTHCSGLQDNEDALMPGEFRVDHEDFPQPLVDYIARRLLPTGENFSPRIWSPENPPGLASYHYSNAGITLLAATLELATGCSLPEIVGRYIFNPLGMTRSFFRLADTVAEAGSNLASPHRGRQPISQYGVAEWPAAQLRSSCTDLCRLLCALTTEDSMLMAQKSFKEMLPECGSGGLAWWGLDATYSTRERGLWEHGGFMDGVRTHIYLWPQLSSGAVILTNGTCDYGSIAAAIKRSVHQSSHHKDD
eukprot:m.343776 g.343776  ORF g.343776 m.343776 type:complete len:542 (-) comp16550_c0_seq87:5661-7286(-)